MLRGLRDCRVVFDGQSRVRSPTGADPRVIGSFLGWSWPRILMGFPEFAGIPWYMPAVSGQSFTQLIADFTDRADKVITPLEPTIYVLCGGFTDLGDGDTPEQVYADAGALGALGRQAGAEYVICTTIPPSTVITGGGNEPDRQATNALILADGDGHFDGGVDFDVDGINDPTDNGSYFDGTHWYGFPDDLSRGTGRAALAARDALAAAVAAVTGG